MTSDLFGPAMEAVNEFDALYKQAQKFRHSTTVDTQDEIDQFDKFLGGFAFLPNAGAPTFNGPFPAWYARCFELSEIGHPDEARPPGRLALDVVEGKVEAEEFFSALDAYKDRIQGVLDACAPARFDYHGFKIKNPEHMGEIKCRYLLEGVDYVVALFKKRGLTPVLRESVATVRLLPEITDCGSGNALGCYRSQERSIDLSAAMVGRGSGRFMLWVNEAFLHEIGHHTHLHYLSPDARQAWDEGWSEVNEKKRVKDLEFGKITQAERKKFFDLLSQNHFDVGKVAKKLKGASKVKFGVWLRAPMTGDPLVKPKQLKLTKHGEQVFYFLANPARFMKEEYDLSPEDQDFTARLERKSRQTADKLGLLWAGDYSVPSEVVKELAKGDSTISKAVDEAMAQLEIVSDYGKTNEEEDFAESFVAFVGAPEKLTPTAKFRMQRALSLSGLYGKPVMRLAERVLTRFELAVGKL